MIVPTVSEWVVGYFCRWYCMCLCCGVRVFLGVGHVLALIVRVWGVSDLGFIVRGVVSGGYGHTTLEGFMGDI